MKVEKRLKKLGIELPKPTNPLGSYVNAVQTGNLLYLAGKGPGMPGKPLPVGKRAVGCRSIVHNSGACHDTGNSREVLNSRGAPNAHEGINPMPGPDVGEGVGTPLQYPFRFAVVC